MYKQFKVSIRYYFLLCSLLGISIPSFAQQPAGARPNILFLLADDWGWPHAQSYGDTIIKTPAFEWVARNGMLFNNAFCAAPSCSPSRAAILTGQYPHRLEEGSQLWGALPEKFPDYAVLLEKAGYQVGLWGKGYGPGNINAGGYMHNPAGKSYKDLESFINSLQKGRPFCFWYGAHKPHRPYVKDIGDNLHIDPASVQVPAYLPRVPEVQRDMLDYYYEVEQFDSACNKAIALLQQKGLLDNTIIVMSGDNGFPFPRSKANVYDGGTHIPLAITWKRVVKPGSVSNAFVNLADLAPTFLEAAGLPVPAQMTARSLLPLLKEQPNVSGRDRVYLEIERHAYARENNAGYPVRAIRTRQFLYIRNFEPQRWPAGDTVALTELLGSFADCDASPSKQFILTHRNLKPEGSSTGKTYFQMAFDKRPPEELYDLDKDPLEMNNVASVKKYQAVLSRFRKELQGWMQTTGDPRATDEHTNIFNQYPYYGPLTRSE